MSWIELVRDESDGRGLQPSSRVSNACQTWKRSPASQELALSTDGGEMGLERRGVPVPDGFSVD